MPNLMSFVSTTETATCDICGKTDAAVDRKHIHARAA